MPGSTPTPPQKEEGRLARTLDRPPQHRLPHAGISYSRFIEGLKAANIELDRRILSDIAIRDEVAFTALVKQAQDALKAKAAAAKKA